MSLNGISNSKGGRNSRGSKGAKGKGKQQVASAKEDSFPDPYKFDSELGNKSPSPDKPCSFNLRKLAYVYFVLQSLGFELCCVKKCLRISFIHYN